MVLPLSEHVLGLLGLTADSAVEDIRPAIEGLGAVAPETIQTADAREELIRIASDPRREKFSISPSAFLIEAWSFHSIALDGIQIGEILEIPRGGDRKDLPTDGDKLLVRVWNADRFEYDRAMKGNCVVATWDTTRSINEGDQQAVLALFNADATIEPPVNLGSWRSAISVSLSAGSGLLDPKMQNSYLLRLALQERSLRWMFIGLYRILEHGYLQQILDGLITQFFNAPADALGKVVNAVNSDLNKLLELVQGQRLEAYFEEFADVIQSLCDNGNRFAHALKRKWDTSATKRLFDTKQKSGVYFCYKIRCAIVHAGSDFLMFERFDDANAAIAELVPTLANAVFDYLSIAITL